MCCSLFSCLTCAFHAHAHMCTTYITNIQYTCTIYTYMHHKKHTFVHRCTLYTYMHCIHIHASHAPQNTCVHRYTYMYHMHTCASHASPIKGTYFCTIHTSVHRCTIYIYMHHMHTCAPHTSQNTGAPPNTAKN